MKNTIEQSNSSSLLNKSLKKFTLLEVIIAMAILSLAIVGILNYSVQASRRMAKASTKWEKEHMLSQAVEFFLLAGPRENIPNDVFPYQNFKAVCEVNEPKLPDEIENEIGSWKLATLKISILNDSGENINSISVDTILQKEDVD